MNTEVLSADASEEQETIESTTATEAFVSEVTAAELLIEEPTQEKIVPVHEKTLPEKSTETISSNETPPTEITTEDPTATQPIENQGPDEEEELLSKEKDSVEIPITEPEEKGEEDLNTPNEKPQPEESKSEEPESEEPQPEKTEPKESTESNDPEVTPETSEKPVLPSVPTEEPTPDAELPLESISVTPPKKEVIVGETLDRLTVEYQPGNAVKPKWEYWWSLNPDIATVDAATGIITAIRAGTAMIMVEVDTGQETG
ncbi:Ig-like domain-containing protein, partial [Carnobacterium sp.]|uniref:Ig-like domain-containing protein n=1 Tax=Carnobacterium sp. TaxID=48221 RepID=UPI0028AE33F4